MFIFLAHPICLCLAMIVHAVQGADDVAGGSGNNEKEFRRCGSCAN